MEVNLIEDENGGAIEGGGEVLIVQEVEAVDLVHCTYIERNENYM